MEIRRGLPHTLDLDLDLDLDLHVTYIFHSMSIPFRTILQETREQINIIPSKNL